MSTPKKYLFIASLTYAYPILRPIQRAIRERGGETAWFVDGPCDEYLRDDERRLHSVAEVKAFDPTAVFTVANSVYDFFPGIKVQVFHGYNIDKRPGRGDHFALKGFFDLYCTQGPSSTGRFEELARKHRYFRVVETGWPKLDNFFHDGPVGLPQNERPTILYGSTFTRWITSAPHLYDAIERLIRSREWDWLLTLHPKSDPEIVARYKALADRYPNVRFAADDDNMTLLRQADVMVCDSSSIIVEFMMLDKPVVTYRNTAPGPHLIDIDEADRLEQAIETALSRPPELMETIDAYCRTMDPHRDGHSAERVVEAVEWFLTNCKGRLPHKPLNLFRKYKMRKRLRYYRFS
ncbi:MAG: CDP-glycerol glycerophosphotransferase family protein [Rikenella sp.]|nr:CDP-glycerol glycerophosphotransferase family protein [Rikenella sp.]